MFVWLRNWFSKVPRTRRPDETSWDGRGWEFFALTLNEEEVPASICVDLRLTDSAPIEDQAKLLMVRVKYRWPGGDLPVPVAQESAALLKIHEELVKAVVLQFGATFAGRLSTPEFREWFFYLKDADDPTYVLDELARTHAAYEWLDREERDPNWSKYLDFLYPSEPARLWIEARDILEAMRELGDDPSQERPIHHWIDLDDPAMQGDLEKALVALRFELVGLDHHGPAGNLARLHFKRTDRAELETLHKLSLELTELARTFGATYDGFEAGLRRTLQ